MYKVTVITVTYNTESNIEETMQSVLSQNYENFEYIIKDGNSSDNTNSKIDSIINKRENKVVPVRHIISPDLGIYGAMNEAVKYANGEWIIFMNAGDVFYNENVLKDVFSLRYKEHIGVLYGHAMLKLISNRKMVVTYDLDIMKKGGSLCHQAVFEKKKYLLKYPFNTEYKIMSDRDHLLKLETRGVEFYHINSIVVKEDRNGISSINYPQLFKEAELINEKYNLKCKKHNMRLGKIKKIIKKKLPILEEIVMIHKNLKRMS